MTEKKKFELDFKSRKYERFIEPNDAYIVELEKICNEILDDMGSDVLERYLATILSTLHQQTIESAGVESKHIYDVPWETLPQAMLRYKSRHGALSGWKDHISVEFNKKTGKALTLVTQPYNLTKKDVLNLIEVTEHFGTDFKIEARFSAHFPGRTFRVKIYLPYYELPDDMREDV